MLATLLIFTFSLSTLFAQNDMMYIIKDGFIVGQYNVNTQIDSIIFYHPTSGKFIDSRDGNIYNWVLIGTQIWMAENLKFLPSVVGPGTVSVTAPYYYVYGYDGTDVSAAKATANYTTYGVLYNWTAAMNGAESSTENPSGLQGVCPTGWHLPSDAEWTDLTDYLGGTSVAGGKLKEVGTTHWDSPNAGATNETGFTALPAGYVNSSFNKIRKEAYWWTTSESGSTSALTRLIQYDTGNIYRIAYGKQIGFSVRCVKD